MASALRRAGASLVRLLVKPRSLHYNVEAVALRYAASVLCLELSASTKGNISCGVSSKVIYTKYSKHCPYTVAHTIECVCSKINHGLNHGLFISLLKLILCPIH